MTLAHDENIPAALEQAMATDIPPFAAAAQFLALVIYY